MRDEIIKMARETGVYTYPEWMDGVPMVLLERFFHLAYAAGAAAERKKSQSRISEEELEALLKWKEEGDQISTKAGLFTLFHLGGWWADRPWRKK